MEPRGLSYLWQLQLNYSTDDLPTLYAGFDMADLWSGTVVEENRAQNDEINADRPEMKLRGKQNFRNQISTHFLLISGCCN